MSGAYLRPGKSEREGEAYPFDGKTFWPEKLSSYVLMIAVGFAGVDKWLSLMSNDDCSDFGVWWCAAWQFDSSLSACP